MSDALSASIRELVADVLGLDPAEVPADASTDSLEAWDSLRHLDVVMALEQRSAASFSPDDIVAMRSIAGIVAILEARGLRA